MLERIHEFARGGLVRELKACGRVLNVRCNKRLGLSLKGLTRMSPILPISFLVTLLCAFGAVEGVLFQQLMFVGAALSATILVCSFEAWSAREIPVRSDDEARLITRITNRLAAEGRQIGLDPILVAAGPAVSDRAHRARFDRIAALKVVAAHGALLADRT